MAIPEAKLSEILFEGQKHTSLGSSQRGEIGTLTGVFQHPCDIVLIGT